MRHSRNYNSLIKGKVQAHYDGFGFLISEESKDAYIPSKYMEGAMNGDTVLCRIVKNSKKKNPEGRVIKILERANKTIVGMIERKDSKVFLIPCDKRQVYNIVLPSEDLEKIEKDQFVEIRITKFPSRKNLEIKGVLEEILGDIEDQSVEIDMIVKKHGIHTYFPQEVLDEADNISETVSKREISARLDLREKKIFTIDGENARDFDDAVSIEPLENSFVLGVHIADVSHYIAKESPLDKEAFKRSTSTYFPDRVIPMLPENISNKICSLVPKEDRLCLSVIMEFDLQGEILNYKISPSVINSCERMTYTDVHTLLRGRDDDLKNRYLHIMDHLILLEKLCSILRRKRMKKGSIDFDLPEPEIILDMQGNPENILRSERNTAHILIEEFMLVTNQVIAKSLSKAKLLSIFRVHEPPEEEKVAEFIDFINNFGLSMKPFKKLQPKYLQKVLEDVKGSPEEFLINYILLRSMRQAEYSIENIGHFGLAFNFYTHFTSPIRRYPDLVIHRIIKGMVSGNNVIYDKEKELSEIAGQASARERVSNEAEREVIKLMRVRFMSDKIGNIYTGTISGVTDFGIFVELDEVFVEGLIHLSKMRDDHYTYMEKEHMLKGLHKNKRYMIGDRVVVRLDKVDRQKRQIDFSFGK